MSLALSSSNRFQTLYLELADGDRTDRMVRLDVSFCDEPTVELMAGSKLHRHHDELLRLPDHRDGLRGQGRPAPAAAHAFWRFLGSHKPRHLSAKRRPGSNCRCRGQ